MITERNDTSLHETIFEINQETVAPPDPEIDICLTIMQKPKEARKPEEIQTVVKRILDLKVFNKSLVENLDLKSVVTKLVPYFQYEKFSAGTPIFHYETVAEKIYVILKGRAREFEPKSLESLEKESRAQYRSDPIPKQITFSLPELSINHSSTSLCSDRTLQDRTLQSLQTLDILPEVNEENEKDKPTSSRGDLVAKKFRKMKALLPFLKKMVEQKTATQRINDYNYKLALRKQKKRWESKENVSMVLEETFEQIDDKVLEEFKKLRRAYFIGGVLKIKFSRYLYSGDCCGMRALIDNALRNQAVIADEDCYCLSLDKADFERIIEAEKALYADKIEFFKKVFKNIETNKVIKFALLWEHLSFQTNETIFQQGETSDSLYALYSGDVVLSKNKPSENKKRVHIGQQLPFRVKKKQDPSDPSIRVATLCAGDFIGDENFFQGNPRDFTASVSSIRAKLFRLPIETYMENSKHFSEIWKEIKSMITLKVKWNNERIEELASKRNILTAGFFSPRTNTRGIEKFLNFSPDKNKPSMDTKKVENPLQRTPKRKTSFVFEHQYNMEGKLAFVRKKVDKFGSFNQSSFVKPDQEKGDQAPPYKINKLLSPQSHRQSINESHSDFQNEESMNMFSRGKLPTFYVPRNEDPAKDPNELPSHFFSSKPRISRRATAETFKGSGTVRTSSIELLKQKVLENKLVDVLGGNIFSARPSSIDLDAKLENLQYVSNHNSQNKIRSLIFQSISPPPQGRNSSLEKPFQNMKVAMMKKNKKKPQQQFQLQLRQQHQSYNEVRSESIDSLIKVDTTLKKDGSRKEHQNLGTTTGSFPVRNLSSRKKSLTLKLMKPVNGKSISNIQPQTTSNRHYQNSKDYPYPPELFRGLQLRSPRPSENNFFPRVPSVKT